MLTASDYDAAVGRLSSVLVETLTRVDTRVVQCYLVNLQSAHTQRRKKLFRNLDTRGMLTQFIQTIFDRLSVPQGCRFGTAYVEGGGVD